MAELLNSQFVTQLGSAAAKLGIYPSRYTVGKIAVFTRILKAPYGSSLRSEVSQIHPGNEGVTDISVEISFRVSDKFKVAK